VSYDRRIGRRRCSDLVHARSIDGGFLLPKTVAGGL
jgi:hypothetical protein